MDAVFRAAAADQRVFDDVVDLGLADGRLHRPHPGRRRPPPHPTATDLPAGGHRSVTPATHPGVVPGPSRGPPTARGTS